MNRFLRLWPPLYLNLVRALIISLKQTNDTGSSLITCFFRVHKTLSHCFPVIIYCVKMRKVESINFRFGGRSTTFCSSVLWFFLDHAMLRQKVLQIMIVFLFSNFLLILKKGETKFNKRIMPSSHPIGFIPAFERFGNHEKLCFKRLLLSSNMVYCHVKSNCIKPQNLPVLKIGFKHRLLPCQIESMVIILA